MLVSQLLAAQWNIIIILLRNKPVYVHASSRPKSHDRRVMESWHPVICGNGRSPLPDVIIVVHNK